MPDERQFYVADVEEHFRPSDDLLRDHCLQYVLACMKATAGPVDLRWFDPDINLGPGDFNLEEGSWWSGPEAKEETEVELAAHLRRFLVFRTVKPLWLFGLPSPGFIDPLIRALWWWP